MDGTPAHVPGVPSPSGTPAQSALSPTTPELAVELRDSAVLLVLCLALLGLVTALGSILVLG